MKTNQLQKNIPTGWQETKLVNIFEFKNGLNKEKKFFGQGTPIINYMDINRGGGLYMDNILGKVEVNKSELDRFNVKKGDVFFTRTSETLDEIGFSAVALDDFQNTVFSGFVLRARPKGKLLIPSYAQYCFRTQKARQEIKEKSSYTTRALTSGSLLNHVSLILPSVFEQNRIVSVLETWDKSIENLNKKIEIKKQIKKGLMQNLLTGKKRLSGFKDKWEVVRLGDVAKMGSGGTPKSTNESYFGGDILWVSIADMTANGKYIYSTFKNLSKEGLENSSAKIYPKDTILYAMYASIGECSIAGVPMTSSQAILGIIPNKEKLDFLFLYFHLCSIKEIIKLQGQQGTQSNLNAGIVKDFKFKIPDVKEQKVIADILTTADKEITELEKKLSIIKEQKKYLLNNLITGTIRTPENLSIKV